MARRKQLDTDNSPVPAKLKIFIRNRLSELCGLLLLAGTAAVVMSLASWSVEDPSLNHAVDKTPSNWLGYPGAIIADLLMQVLGLGVVAFLAPAVAWALKLLVHQPITSIFKRCLSWIIGAITSAGVLALLARPEGWPLPTGLGGVAGDILANIATGTVGFVLGSTIAWFVCIIMLGFLAVLFICHASAIQSEAVLRLARFFGEGAYEAVARMAGGIAHLFLRGQSWMGQRPGPALAGAAGSHGLDADLIGDDLDSPGRFSLKKIGRRVFDRFSPADEDDHLPPVARIAAARREPSLARGGHAAPIPTWQLTGQVDREEADEQPYDEYYEISDGDEEPAHSGASDTPHVVTPKGKPLKPGRRAKEEAQPPLPFNQETGFELPPLALLAEPRPQHRSAIPTEDALQQNARMLEGVLEDFGVRGQIINVKPGPVVTLYELEPAPGIKSSRVIGLADDIARSMSAVSARVAVVPGRNVIGIELPNARRDTVYLRELLASEAFEKSNQDLALALGKNIGGEPVFADLARMPHLLIAGTTGSGKSVGINTMILSLLYRLPPERCRLIMIDPKMLELSIYEGIPHLLTPVVTDPRKAVVALKWAVREMEDRYRKMSKVGVRNIDGFNKRIEQAKRKGEILTRTVQTGFNPETGEPIYEQEEMRLDALPYIVVIVDEMADLMMVAGKEIEGAIQRLAQMARAAGIHLIMATQRPSVDVITGTIKANFPTRISFQVTSKIDSRTILGEMGAEQLLGQGDMLYMAGGGRITRLHGAFVSDQEVERIVEHLKSQGMPEYLQDITEEIEGEVASGSGADSPLGEASDDIYAQAVAVVLRDRKASTSYIQRRLQIGYNRAASLIERMEQEGIISPANHAGKRAVLVGEGPDADD